MKKLFLLLDGPAWAQRIGGKSRQVIEGREGRGRDLKLSEGGHNMACKVPGLRQTIMFT